MATVARERESPARTKRSQNCRSNSGSVIPRSPLLISHAVVRAISLSFMPPIPLGHEQIAAVPYGEVGAASTAARSS